MLFRSTISATNVRGTMTQSAMTIARKALARSVALIFKTREKTLTLEIWELRKVVSEAVSTSDVLDHRFERIPKPANDRLPVAFSRID